MSLKVLQMLGLLMKVKRSPSSKGRLLTSYVGKAKDYPGAKEMVNMNKQGVIGKKKPKLRIV